MRRCLAAACLVLAAGALLPAPARAEDWSLESYLSKTSEWDGFPVGTTVHRRLTNELFRPGAEDVDVRVEEMKRKLVAVREDAIVLEVSRQVGGRWRTERRTIPRRDPTKVEQVEVGEAELEIDRATFPCRKIRVARPGPRGPEELVLWANEHHGILRIETLRPAPSVVTVTKLAQTVRVDDRELDTRTFRLEVGAGTGRRTGTLVLSLQVPEAMVAADIRAEGDPPPFRAKDELVRLELPGPATAPEPEVEPEPEPAEEPVEEPEAEPEPEPAPEADED